jgi:hypothetical protein
MGVYINGMEMPTSCDECPLYTCMHNHDNCPLVPVPPFGRLIDADAIPFVESENGCLDDYAFRYDINQMPTIIPAEEGE